VKTALVTGGSTGIGLALVRALVKRGVRVAVNARSEDKLRAIAEELGDRVIILPADVADPAKAQEVVREAHARLGSLDLVVANAGTGRPVHGSKMKVEAITHVLQLNVIGACATVAAAVEPMVAQGRGHIVGITSVAANRGLPTSAAYSGSKAGFSVFLESLRVDLRRTGVRVTEIRPGFVDTPLTKKNRFKMPWLMDADRAAELILRAVERERKVYTFPWQMAAVSWLMRQLPNAIWDLALSRAKV